MDSVTPHYLKRLSFLILVLICLGKTVEGASMSLFSKEKHEVVISSPFEGVITYKGEPAAGATVERKLKWKDEKGETDSVETDQNGRFSLPIIEDVISLSPVTQFAAHQKITIIYEDEIYQIWIMGKLEKELYSELGGKPENLICELTNELRRVEIEGGMLGTICKWDSINKQI